MSVKFLILICWAVFSFHTQSHRFGAWMSVDYHFNSSCLNSWWNGILTALKKPTMKKPSPNLRFNQLISLGGVCAEFSFRTFQRSCAHQIKGSSDRVVHVVGKTFNQGGSYFILNLDNVKASHQKSTSLMEKNMTMTSRVWAHLQANWFPNFQFLILRLLCLVTT